MNKISIVIAYYNRHKLLLETINSISQTKYINYEIIIVDDCSDDIDIVKQNTQHNDKIKIIHIDKQTKGTRTNPCSVFNTGFNHTTGDIIIIQNPESYHIDDIITYTANHLREQEYLVYSAYNLHSEKANNCFITLQNKTYSNLINPDIIPQEENKLQWYHHEKYRRSYYHFCSAIHKTDLQMIGYFDDNYKHGVCFDDDDLLLKIRDIAKYAIRTPNPEIDPFVVNMYHLPSLSTDIDKQSNNNPIKQRWMINKKYYETKKQLLNKFFTYPRILHLYWHGKLSFLNYLTVISFHKYHPAWIINVYTTNKAITDIPWKTPEQKTNNPNTKNYLFNLQTLPYINIINIDTIVEQLNIDKKHSVHQSDIIRFHMLNKYGGVWSDFDIIYLKNIEEYFINRTKPSIFKCHDTKTGNIYYPVGFFICNPSSIIFKYTSNKQLELIKSNLNQYQVFGSELIKELITNNKLEQYYDVYGKEYYLYFAWNELDNLYNKHNTKFHKNTFGIHWFNGSHYSQQYINRFNKQQFTVKSTMDALINDYLSFI